MSEWWTYGLSDFLMFSPEAYRSLVARYNAAWWPAQLAAVAAGCGVYALLWRHDAAASRAVLFLLAAGWAWVGAVFHARYYAEIFLAAPWFAWACGVQALLLLVAAGLKAGARAQPPPAAAHGGRLLVALAVLFPVAAPLLGRGWQQAEVLGFMPDPTALASLGALLALAHPRAALRSALAVIPASMLLLGAATRWLLA